MSEEMERKLKELMVLLDREYHPHTSIIVTSISAELVEGVACVTNNDLRD